MSTTYRELLAAQIRAEKAASRQLAAASRAAAREDDKEAAEWTQALAAVDDHDQIDDAELARRLSESNPMGGGGGGGGYPSRAPARGPARNDSAAAGGSGGSGATTGSAFKDDFLAPQRESDERLRRDRKMAEEFQAAEQGGHGQAGHAHAGLGALAAGRYNPADFGAGGGGGGGGGGHPGGAPARGPARSGAAATGAYGYPRSSGGAAAGGSDRSSVAGETDAQFAARIQRLERAEADAKAARDLAAARAFSNQLNAPPPTFTPRAEALQRPAPPRQLSAADRKRLEEILKSDAVAGIPGANGQTDAHTHTRGSIHTTMPFLMAIDDRYGLSSSTTTPTPPLTPAQVETEVRNFVTGHGRQHIAASKHPDYVRINPSHIRTTFYYVGQNGRFCPETGVDVPDLLNRVLKLARKRGLDEMALLTVVLSDNIGDAGKCIPGLVARLYSLYACMIGSEFGLDRPNTVKVVTTTTVRHQ